MKLYCLVLPFPDKKTALEALELSKKPKLIGWVEEINVPKGIIIKISKIDQSKCDGVCEQCPEPTGKQQCEMWRSK